MYCYCRRIENRIENTTGCVHELALDKTNKLSNNHYQNWVDSLRTLALGLTNTKQPYS